MHEGEVDLQEWSKEDWETETLSRLVATDFSSWSSAFPRTFAPNFVGNDDSVWDKGVAVEEDIVLEMDGRDKRLNVPMESTGSGGEPGGETRCGTCNSVW